MLAFTTNEDLEKVVQVKAIIKKDYKYHFTHQQLACRVHMNESKLRHAFKHYVGMAIYEYLIFLRIEKAKELLSETDLPINLIADKVGYDTRSLNRQFKKLTQISPLRWRREFGFIQEGKYNFMKEER